MSDEIQAELVFLTGFPRSGTTYLQSLLSTQPEIISFQETHYFRLLRGLTNNKTLSRSEVIRCATKLITEAHLPESISNITDSQLTKKELFNKIIRKLVSDRLKPDVKYFLEKTPGHFDDIPEILDLYPNSKIIYIERNPHEAIYSYLENFKHVKNSNSANLAARWSKYHNTAKLYNSKLEDSFLAVNFERITFQH